MMKNNFKIVLYSFTVLILTACGGGGSSSGGGGSSNSLDGTWEGSVAGMVVVFKIKVNSIDQITGTVETTNKVCFTKDSIHSPSRYTDTTVSISTTGSGTSSLRTTLWITGRRTNANRIDAHFNMNGTNDSCDIGGPTIVLTKR